MGSISTYSLGMKPLLPRLERTKAQPSTPISITKTCCPAKTLNSVLPSASKSKTTLPTAGLALEGTGIMVSMGGGVAEVAVGVEEEGVGGSMGLGEDGLGRKSGLGSPLGGEAASGSTLGNGRCLAEEGITREVLGVGGSDGEEVVGSTGMLDE